MVAMATLVFAGEKNPENSFIQTNFVANKTSYKPQILEKDFINGWGIAIRPKGQGGHFWVTAKNISYEYIGDVQNSPHENLHKLGTDSLKYVTLPIGTEDNFATGVVFSDSTKDFVITQKPKDADPITAPAKFIFASDGGIISAWTERKKADGTFDRANEALTVIDQSKEGAQFFGLAINADYNRLYVADFGSKPSVKVFDGKFQPASIAFDMPFDENKNKVVDAGEYAPFNVQALTTPKGDNHIFVTYAKTQVCPAEEVKAGTCKAGELFVGEEDTSQAGYGRVAEFTEDGKLVSVLPDAGKLSAPWGIAYAPADFGAFSNALLVANLGDGTISGYDSKTHKFIDVMRDKAGQPIVNDKIWGLLFGNGETLGDKNALYFAAGPVDETDGVFGSLRLKK